MGNQQIGRPAGCEEVVVAIPEAGHNELADDEFGAPASIVGPAKQLLLVEAREVGPHWSESYARSANSPRMHWNIAIVGSPPSSRTG
jgi:hypothetical protein